MDIEAEVQRRVKLALDAERRRAMFIFMLLTTVPIWHST